MFSFSFFKKYKKLIKCFDFVGFVHEEDESYLSLYILTGFDIVIGALEINLI